MSPTHEQEAAEVKRRLAPLAQTPTELPAADAVYWRAQARLAIEQEHRRRTAALRPLRRFQLAIGLAAVVLAAVASVWPLFLQVSPTVGLVAVPLQLAMLAGGAYLLVEVPKLT